MKIYEFEDVQNTIIGFEHDHFKRFGTPDDVLPQTLVYCDRIDFLKKALSNDNVTAIITKPALIDGCTAKPNKTVWVTTCPSFQFWNLFNRFVGNGDVGMRMEYGIDNTCRIHPTAVVSDKVLLGKNVVIGERVIIGDHTILGDGTEIGPGVVVGAEGLQTASNGVELIHIRHAGGVRIGRGSKILANSVVAKGLLPIWTEIGDSTYVAILVSVGHQSKIGSNCQISSNSVIGGSAIVEDRVVIGPSSTISSSIVVGTGAKIRLGSVVIKNVEPEAEVSGNFAGNHLAHIRSYLGKQ